MAVPERRVRGWVLVVILVVAGSLAAIPILLVYPATHFGPPLLLIRAVDNISALPASTTVPADFGPHCTKYTWNPVRRFLAVESDTSLAGVEGLALNHYVEQERNFVSNGGDYTRPFLLTNGSGWELRSPIDGRALAALGRSGANVTVNGTSYAPGSSWTLHFEYDATTPGGTVHVTEDLSLVNEGVIETRVVPAAPCA